MRVWTDSSAAMGICARQGLGKLMHLDTHTLWVQQAVRSGRIELKKVPGEENPADTLTKHLSSRQKLMQLVKFYHCEYRDGRAASVPIMRKGASDKRTMATESAEEEDLMMAESDENVEVVMPHLEYGRQQLDAMYPSAEVVEPDVLDDVEIEDQILNHGLKFASTI